ncbi:MAG: ABC transporter ATP-binding protein [Endomicrobiia bacterium]|nr:ABC transporter ATP-binding protein [Endomicrobiia bacterium]
MIELRNINYRAGDFALNDISFSASRAEYFALLGPTGSGKTLLLKILAGLIPPSSGGVFFDSEDVTRLAPEDRAFGYVAQDYRLFSHLNAVENILFSPRVRRLPDDAKGILLGDIVSKLDIAPLLKRRVTNLSGGERQRVALARTLASRPSLVLLDEPFSAIDEGLKKHLWFEIKGILSAAGVPVIHVTHDIEEAVTLADKIAVVIDGKIRQTGTPKDILLRPSSERIARYLGIKNIFVGRVVSGDSRGYLIEISGAVISAPVPPESLAVAPEAGDEVTVCARPQSVKIIRPSEAVRDELKENMFDGVIVGAYFFSDSVSVFVKCGDLVWEARLPHAVYHRNELSVGKKIIIALWRPDVMVYK